MQLSPHFTLLEFTNSDTAKKLALPNVPDLQSKLNMALLASNVLEPLRQWYGKPITLNSGFRTSALNKAVGGVSNSQHMLGQAADINISDSIPTAKKMMEYIRDNLVFDQLILEHNTAGIYWLHVSYKAEGNRRQVIGDLLKKRI